MAAPRLAPRQAAIYAAEAATTDRTGRSWSSLRAAQAYVDALVSSEWFFDRWPSLVKVTIERRGSGATWSTCHALDGPTPTLTPTEGVILVAGRPIAQSTVLHELAHLLVPPDSGHGPEFVQTLLSLVRAEMGFFAYADLLHALHP